MEAPSTPQRTLRRRSPGRQQHVCRWVAPQREDLESAFQELPDESLLTGPGQFQSHFANHALQKSRRLVHGGVEGSLGLISSSQACVLKMGSSVLPWPSLRLQALAAKATAVQDCSYLGSTLASSRYASARSRSLSGLRSLDRPAAVIGLGSLAWQDAHLNSLSDAGKQAPFSPLDDDAATATSLPSKDCCGSPGASDSASTTGSASAAAEDAASSAAGEACHLLSGDSQLGWWLPTSALLLVFSGLRVEEALRFEACSRTVLFSLTSIQYSLWPGGRHFHVTAAKREAQSRAEAALREALCNQSPPVHLLVADRHQAHGGDILRCLLCNAFKRTRGSARASRSGGQMFCSPPHRPGQVLPSGPVRACCKGGSCCGFVCAQHNGGAELLCGESPLHSGPHRCGLCIASEGGLSDLCQRRYMHLAGLQNR
eukprot:TRINITY_DN111985_c0_g1_i1.p1 TRINITY_DN111985_c0_g1~~TRINITY_DN111985_c0_g1_i1.p1  ORF type:complete len:429 (+),score=46.20 TRINITY_DN111985_c0_g1_i1:92-1378(+)